ncbi:hypothetical protein CTAYLR_010113 [Chrysophaeum taylorii]|uniref:Uncharacterized protein n=1 Tax=Chrysophaeum taylorii TaxID=2483200 RepID=A0AAD7UG34_9STRA|nr:hypothetical protein CTAYLR_010113 [Chrysophaeum taylorii]
MANEANATQLKKNERGRGDLSQRYAGPPPRRRDQLQGSQVVKGDRLPSKDVAVLRVLDENEAARRFVKTSGPWLGPTEEGQNGNFLRNLASKATLRCKCQGRPYWVCMRGTKDGEWYVEEVLEHTCKRGSYKPAKGESRSNYARKHLMILAKDLIMHQLMSGNGNNTRKRVFVDLPRSVLSGVMKQILQLEVHGNTLQQLKQVAIVEYLGSPEDDAARM